MLRTVLLCFAVVSMSCKAFAQEFTFSELALTDTFVSDTGEVVSFASILEANKGKTLFLDIWASWCRDCIIGIPALKELQQKYKDLVFVYISLDRSKEEWQNGIKKYNIQGGLHYWSKKGWKSDFFSEIDLDWIPRYMILDGEGRVKLFKAIKVDDTKIKNNLNKKT